MQTWTHSRRSGRTTIDVMTLAELCLITAGHLSNVFFTVVSGAAVYTFVFYKGQAVVQQLLPESRVMFLVKTYIIIAYCLKASEFLPIFIFFLFYVPSYQCFQMWKIWRRGKMSV
ncbi:hypothetical protein LSTR_LSTR017006 [Laodelphax striatellus]|uniref:Uncharacterized protein n=1 Tax=Laodelphax striatellus TaxID=195883 RepID=A0A482X070_LAOST|nr:hypothetical protein LSTR_LSTR017006 [Laodelphax striatellus]